MTDQRRLQGTRRAPGCSRQWARWRPSSPADPPLSTSVLYAGQLAKDSLNDTQRRQFSDKLLDSLRHTELVRGCWHSVAAAVSPPPIHLDDMLHAALPVWQPRLRQMRAALPAISKVPTVGAWSAATSMSLAGAFSNLIDNALNRGQGVAITISRCDDAEVAATLGEDDGRGSNPRSCHASSSLLHHPRTRYRPGLGPSFIPSSSSTAAA